MSLDNFIVRPHRRAVEKFKAADGVAGPDRRRPGGTGRGGRGPFRADGWSAPYMAIVCWRLRYLRRLRVEVA